LWGWDVVILYTSVMGFLTLVLPAVE